MAPRNWIYSINTFEVQTRNSFKKMLSLDLDHYGKLVAAAALEPAIIPLRDDYLPLHQAYQSIYSNWIGAEGTHEGSTVTVEDLLEQITPELKKWEGTVRYVFPEDSGEERSIFPNKRGPFQTGTYEQRISAIRTLYQKLLTFPGQPLLLALSATVQSFYNTIEAKRLAQTGDELSITAQRNLLETQRILCATGMYGNLGRLMYIFRDNPVQVEQFWDLTLLRNIAENAYTESLTVDPHSHTAVGLSADERESVEANTPIIIKNSSSSSSSLKVGFTTDAGTLPTLLITLVPEGERELSASELGWSSEKKYLMVVNETDEAGTLDVEVGL